MQKLNLQVLENDLVKLTPLEEKDFAALYSIASDPNIWKHHPASNRYKKDAFTLFFNNALSSLGAYIIWDKIEQKIIGSSRFNSIPNRDDIVEIGWSFLAVSYWGRKYNLAFKKLMIDYALTKFSDVLFYVDIENIISQKAMVNLGATQVSPCGTQHIPGKRSNTYIYYINKQNWKY